LIITQPVTTPVDPMSGGNMPNDEKKDDGGDMIVHVVLAGAGGALGAAVGAAAGAIVAELLIRSRRSSR
jgi:hypothetical protein